MDIDEFGRVIAGIKADSQTAWAEIIQVTSKERGEVDPSNEETINADDHDDGLLVVYRTISGNTFREWYPKPDEWSSLRFNLVLLLQYLQVPPKHVGDLEGHDVPVRTPGGEIEPHWDEMAHVLAKRRKERD